VDDVVTTGASLLDAERALAWAGIGTLGAAVLAVTPPSGHAAPGGDER
jgi:predicted amidophosphoribosyltransferase